MLRSLLIEELRRIADGNATRPRPTGLAKAVLRGGWLVSAGECMGCWLKAPDLGLVDCLRCNVLLKRREAGAENQERPRPPPAPAGG